MRLARALRVAGLAIMGVFAFVGAAFIAGETFTDPGGWQAAGLVAAWLVPLVVLSVLAWARPAVGIVVLTTLVVAVLALSVWFVIDPNGWRSFEDENGPVRAVAVFSLAVPLAVLGWDRAMPAGLLLLVLAVAPPVVSAVGSREGLTSLGVVAVPALVTGLLYVVSARIVSADNSENTDERPSRPAGL